jgi:probable HAF family extracellular repeat protein
MHPFRWVNGVMTDLDSTTTNQTVGYGINSDGQIAGYFGTTMTIPGSAFLSSGATFTNLGSALGDHSPAFAINDSGVIAGERNLQHGGIGEAYTYDTSTSTLTTLPGIGGTLAAAEAINSNGDVAGIATTAASATHAVRWIGGTATDLDTLGGTYSYGYRSDRRYRTPEPRRHPRIPLEPTDADPAIALLSPSQTREPVGPRRGSSRVLGTDF